jgi:hypothetical protein
MRQEHGTADGGMGASSSEARYESHFWLEGNPLSSSPRFKRLP